MSAISWRATVTPMMTMVQISSPRLLKKCSLLLWWQQLWKRQTKNLIEKQEEKRKRTKECCYLQQAHKENIRIIIKYYLKTGWEVRQVKYVLVQKWETMFWKILLSNSPISTEKKNWNIEGLTENHCSRLLFVILASVSIPIGSSFRGPQILQFWLQYFNYGLSFKRY